MSNWQPIATAPTDGSDFLLTGKVPGHELWTGVYVGWRGSLRGIPWGGWKHDFEPTHWMPIPDPPEVP